MVTAAVNIPVHTIHHPFAWMTHAIKPPSSKAGTVMTPTSQMKKMVEVIQVGLEPKQPGSRVCALSSSHSDVAQALLSPDSASLLDTVPTGPSGHAAGQRQLRGGVLCFLGTGGRGPGCSLRALRQPGSPTCTASCVEHHSSSSAYHDLFN